MNKPQNPFPLENEFGSTCATLAALAALPGKQRPKALEAKARFEAAAMALIDMPAAERRPKTWLRHAAASLSPALVRAFGPAPAGSVHIPVGNFPWSRVAKKSCPEHLEAMMAAGLDMRGGHKDLLDRALTARGSNIHSFLETHAESLWSKSSFINKFTTSQITRQPGFFARYLQTAKAHHYEDFQWWLGTAMRSFNGRDVLILHCLGIELKEDDFAPDAARLWDSNLSAHRQMQIEGWKQDLASLLSDRAALDWAKDNLIRLS